MTFLNGKEGKCYHCPSKNTSGTNTSTINVTLCCMTVLVNALVIIYMGCRWNVIRNLGFKYSLANLLICGPLDLSQKAKLCLGGNTIVRSGSIGGVLVKFVTFLGPPKASTGKIPDNSSILNETAFDALLRRTASPKCYRVKVKIISVVHSLDIVKSITSLSFISHPVTRLTSTRDSVEVEIHRAIEFDRREGGNPASS